MAIHGSGGMSSNVGVICFALTEEFFTPRR